MDPAGTAWKYSADKDFPRDVTLLRANATLVFEDGSPANVDSGVYNHHLIFVDTSKSVPGFISCDGKPNGGIPISIFAGGSEDKGDDFYTTKDGKFDSGYYIGKNDAINIAGDVVNYTNEQKTVFTVAEFEYIEGNSGFLDAALTIFNVGQCDGQTKVALPQALEGNPKWNVKSKKPLTISRDGYIVAASKYSAIFHSVPTIADQDTSI
jgi:hypothetical protein